MLTALKRKTLYLYFSHIYENPRIRVRKFHKKYSPYKQEKTTYDLIKFGFQKEILNGPYLFANRGISTELVRSKESPLGMLEEKKDDPNTTMAVALCGDWSFISFSKGASTLSFAETIKPTFSGLSKIEEINFENIEKGRLPPDPYPRGWDDLDWKVYDAISNPKDLSFPKAAEKLGVSWVTVKNHYQKILPQCKVMMCFFPEGSSSYAQLFITFRTKYEVGYAHCLKTLDRTSYIYKDGHRVLSVLFINRERYDNVTALFKELEEIGIIHDLCVSIPIKWWKPNKV